MIWELIFLLVGLGVGYVIYDISLFMNRKYLRVLIKTIRKKKPIALLETDKAIYIKPIEKVYRNLGLTKDKEVIVMPKSSMKPVMNFGGIPIVHGDLYKSVTTPQEVRKFIDERLRDGWKDEDIADFLQEIETNKPEEVKKKYKKLKEEGKSKIDKQKYDIYVNLPSVIKDYIYTGLNRVSIHDMIREMVYQRELEKLGKRNWITIAVAIMIIVLAVAIGLNFVLSTPGITNAITHGISTAPQIAPR